MTIDLAFAAAVLLAATPIMLAALGGALSARAGVFNIALEGQMLWGAFAAVVGSAWTGSAWAGVAVAVVTAALSSLVLAVGTAWWGADPTIIAIGANLFALGITGFLLRMLFGASGSYTSATLQGLPKMTFLDGVPVLGPLLAGQTPIVPAAFVLVALVAVWLSSTPGGLRLRGVGEHAEAAAAIGVDVPRYRAGAVVVAGALSGLAGAQLSLGNVTVFTENMTAGRGWIAVAAVMLVAARPGLLPIACLGFGAAEAFGFRLQGAGAPPQLTDAAPYLLTLVVLVLTRLRVAHRTAS